jgi:hypothetical protein
MRRRLYIPKEVKNSIFNHFQHSIDKAIDGYLSANEDEDTLTGHLGACLRIKNQTVEVPSAGNELPGKWTWSIDYYKFRGRVGNAPENFLGADGIFELKLNYGSRTEKKSLLFQAKKEWHNSDPSLFNQCIKLSTWREASFVLNYRPTTFEAILLDDVIRSRGSRQEITNVVDLANFLGNDFLDCEIGDNDLEYDAITRRLIWRNYNGLTVGTIFLPKRRIRLKINSPKMGNIHKDYIEIPNSHIYNHRMGAYPEDILSLGPQYTQQDLKKARRASALTYHLDKINILDELNKRILNRRMQEINGAYDELHIKRKRK